MIEKTKRRKKGVITEEDISSLLQRYTATTVLALLQEVAQFEGVKIDWNALVKKTSTGISNAREYQMLWRHLVYRHTLLEKLGDGAEPLDDDSDLEYELEAFPEVSTEASTEASACVKVLIASGLPSESGHPNSSTVEAPLTINIPNGQLLRVTSENAATRSVNITVPVSVQKQPLPSVTTSEGLDANGTSGGSNTRKRRKWLPEEDSKLIAAVEKHGEGNWANILRGEFKVDRTPAQLSQRWAFLRKKQRLPTVGSNSGGSQLSEAQRAARHAMNLALDPPVRNVASNSSAGATLNGLAINSKPSSTSSESLPAQYQSQQRPMMMKSSSLGPLDSAGKPQVNLKTTSMKSNFASDPVRAAAVAAGARIATQSDAASLLKAAQAKNAVHIMPVGGSAVKTSMPGSIPSHLDSAPNVHFISTGLGTTPAAITPVSTGGPSQGLVKAPTSSTQCATVSSATLCDQKNTEHTPKEDAKVARVVDVSRTEDAAKRQVQDGECSNVNESSKQVQESNAASTSGDAEQKSAVAENSNALPKVDIIEGDRIDVGGKVDEDNKNSKDTKITSSPPKELEQQPQVPGNGQNQSLSEPQSSDLKSTVADECVENGKNQSDPIQPCKIVSTET